MEFNYLYCDVQYFFYSEKMKQGADMLSRNNVSSEE